MMRFGFMMKGVKMIAEVHRTAMKRKVPIHRNVKNLRAEGDERLELVKATCGRKELSFVATTLLVNEGIIPNTSLSRQVGCAHTWDPVQRYWHPDVTSEGRSNLPRVFVAGDGNFVHGAKSTGFKGMLTGMAIAKEMHRLSTAEFELKAGPV